MSCFEGGGSASNRKTYCKQPGQSPLQMRGVMLSERIVCLLHSFHFGYLQLLTAYLWKPLQPVLTAARVSINTVKEVGLR